MPIFTYGVKIDDFAKIRNVNFRHLKCHSLLSAWQYFKIEESAGGIVCALIKDPLKIHTNILIYLIISHITAVTMCKMSTNILSGM